MNKTTAKPTKTESKSREKHDSKLEAFFLPDLCNPRAIFVLMVIAEALVLALTLMDTQVLEDFSWSHFFITSFFVQWVALLSASALCALRQWLASLSITGAVALSLIVTQLITLSISVISELIAPVFNVGIEWEWILRNQLVSGIYTAMALRYFYVQSQLRFKAQAELRARLSALQANIRPHFFFNTLNTLASLIAIDPDKAERLLIELSRLFRAVLKTSSSSSSLQDEIELCRGYLEIEQTRLGNRISAEWQLPHPLPDIQLPQLSIQPLLENAVYHGIQPNIEPGYVKITLNQMPDEYILEIANSKGKNKGTTEGHGLAQKNIKARLQALYADQAQLETQDSESQYIARLRIPKHKR